MATPMILDTAEPDPRSHQGYADVMRDMLIAAARQTATQADFATTRRARPEIFALPMGAPALTTHDVQQSGAETAIADLTLRTDLDQLGLFVEGMRERLVERWNEQAEKNRIASERIAKLESLVQEQAAESDALRTRLAAAEASIYGILVHNDRIANTISPVVLGVAQINDLVKAAPALLALVPHEEG